MSNQANYDNLARLLQSMPKQTVTAEFDNKFWTAFENHVPVVAAPVAAIPAFAFAGAGVVSVAAMALLVMTHIVDVPKITVTQGEVSYKTREVKQNDKIETASTAWAILELENGYRVKIEPNSQVEIKSLKPKWLPGKTVMQLKKGQALVSIGDQIHRKYPVEIHTFNAFARAMGTQFIVTAGAGPDQASKVTVIHGVVKAGGIQNDKKINQVDIPAGNELSIEGTTLKMESLVENTKRDLQELFQFSQKNRAILLISVSPGRVRELLRPCVIYIRLESKSVVANKITAIALQIQKSQETDFRVPVESIRELETIVTTQNEMDPVPLMLFIGSYYASIGEYENAIRIFQKTQEDHPDSQLASLALMAIAEIQHTHLEDKVAAQKTAYQILSDYGDSLEAEDARKLAQ